MFLVNNKKRPNCTCETSETERHEAFLAGADGKELWGRQQVARLEGAASVAHGSRWSLQSWGRRAGLRQDWHRTRAEVKHSVTDPGAAERGFKWTEGSGLPCLLGCKQLRWSQERINQSERVGCSLIFSTMTIR